MLLLDLNQIAFSNLHMQVLKMSLSENMIRHMVYNSIRMYNQKFAKEYGAPVICCDSKRYWRRDVFPHYKAGRKKSREKSNLDWNMVFATLNSIREDLAAFFPYKVLNIEGAEADDVIAALVQNYHAKEPILILSGDKDFQQLQRYPNVRQYSPVQKKFIESSDPVAYLKEHILRGDSGDGVPNFLSNDDTFVTGERQRVINSGRLNEWLNQEPNQFCTNETLLRNYKRNQMLVDFDYIPKELTQNIVSTYDSIVPAKRNHLLDYFIERRLSNLIEHIEEF